MVDFIQDSQAYICITGATGFLGSHLLKYLLFNTNYNFVLIKRTSSSLTRLENIDKTRVYFFDVDENFENLEECFKDKKIISIIHCATNYGRNAKTCLNILKTNLNFPIKLLELAVKYNVISFINTDSYFNKPNMSYFYLQDYSLSKRSLRLWLEYFSSKIKIANVVLEHIYGENDSLEKFVPFLINEIAVKNSLEINLTGGEQKRDFIYVDDVVCAYKYILDFTLTRELKYKNFDLGTGIVTSIKDFANTVKRESSSHTKLNFGALPYRTDEIMLSKAENSDLLNLGWKPRYTIQKGIKKYISNERKQTLIYSHTNI